MANSKKVRLHKQNESAPELRIDFSSIPKWKRDLIDTVADLSVKRVKLRMTQEALAQKMGVRQPVVARFEYMGRTPGLESIYKYAEGLGVEMKPLKIVSPILSTYSVDDELDLPKPDIPKWRQNIYELIADLKVCRLEQRISQTELAKRMGTSQSVITRFERMGRIPTIEFIYKVAEALGVELSISELLSVPFPISTIIWAQSWTDSIIISIAAKSFLSMYLTPEVSIKRLDLEGQTLQEGSDQAL